MKRQYGFTLLEILLSLVLLSILSVLIVQGVSVLSNITGQAQIEAERETNRLLSNALLNWSAEQTGTVYGQLPAPFSGSVGGETFNNAIVNPASATAANVSIRTALNESGAAIDKIYDDGSAASNVRVYQLLNNETTNLPLLGFAGETAAITYDVGVVYSTFCQRVDTTCNTGLPGPSVALTTANASTFTVAGDDYGAFMISTLSIQRRGLQRSMQKLDFIKERMRETFRALELTGAPGDTTNWFYAPNAAGSPNLAGADPTTNLDCYDGWYDLTDADVNVLELYDLNHAEFSVTEWGGEIFYCRDYSPSASGEGVQPHAAALKVHRSVTTATTPTNVQVDNIVVSF